MTLDQFLKDNRAEIIRRTRAKVESRRSPPASSAELEHGVPLFLSQLSATLEDEGLGGAEHPGRPSHPTHRAIGDSAALHGRDMLKFGFTIEQVVHDYGDVCQAVTELAEQLGASLSIAEFHTLNRCLDNAIAGAVSSWSQERERTLAHKTDKASDTARRDLGRLLEQAKTAFDVIRAGRVGASGATGTILQLALAEMRAIIDKVG